MNIADHFFHFLYWEISLLCRWSGLIAHYSILEISILLLLWAFPFEMSYFLSRSTSSAILYFIILCRHSISKFCSFLSAHFSLRQSSFVWFHFFLMALFSILYIVSLVGIVCYLVFIKWRIISVIYLFFLVCFFYMIFFGDVIRTSLKVFYLDSCFLSYYICPCHQTSICNFCLINRKKFGCQYYLNFK